VQPLEFSLQSTLRVGSRATAKKWRREEQKTVQQKCLRLDLQPDEG